jgi:hypothetical protein
VAEEELGPRSNVFEPRFHLAEIGKDPGLHFEEIMSRNNVEKPDQQTLRCEVEKGQSFR